MRRVLPIVLMLLAVALTNLAAGPQGVSAAPNPQSAIGNRQFDWQRLDTVHFAIFFPPEEGPGAVIFGRRAEQIRRRVIKEIGQDFKLKVQVYLAPDRDTYRALLGNSRKSEWSIGSALPGQDTIVMFSPRGTYREKVRADSAQTFAHELAHITLFNVLRRQDIPMWLQEGIAQMVSGERSAADTARLTIAVLADHLIPLDELTYRWPTDESRARLAYAEALSLVLYLRDNLFLTPLLVNMRDGQDAVAALEKTADMDLLTLEKQWHEYLRRKHTWIMLFDEGCLWAFAALLLVVGYFVVRWQRRKQYAKLDEPTHGRRRGRHYDDIDDLIENSKWGDGWY